MNLCSVLVHFNTILRVKVARVNINELWALKNKQRTIVF